MNSSEFLINNTLWETSMLKADKMNELWRSCVSSGPAEEIGYAGETLIGATCWMKHNVETRMRQCSKVQKYYSIRGFRYPTTLWRHLKSKDKGTTMSGTAYPSMHWGEAAHHPRQAAHPSQARSIHSFQLMLSVAAIFNKSGLTQDLWSDD